MAKDSAIQDFFVWLLHKSSSLQTSHKPAAIRAFYYSLTLENTLNHARARTLGLNSARTLDLKIDSDLILEKERSLDSALVLALDRALDRAFQNTLELDLDSALNLSLTRARVLDSALPLDLIARLCQLQKELPTLTRSNEIQDWWSLHNDQWSKRLRQVMIEHRNIGHNWEFTVTQKQQLQRYYEANNFLVKLMKIEGAVSEMCRTAIEEELLLPWAELQRRQPHLYKDLKE